MPWDRKTSLLTALTLFFLLIGVLFWSFVYKKVTHFQAGRRPENFFEPPPPPAPTQPPLRTADPTRGSKETDAVLIIEYGDRLEPQTRLLEREVRKILQAQPVPVRLVWRDVLPAKDRVEPLSVALAVRCAGEQSKYWEMHDAIMESVVVTYDQLKITARKIGLDVSSFDTCFMSQDRLASLIKDTRLASQYHITSSPTLFIGGKTYVGPMSVEQLSAALWWANRNR